MRTAAEMYEYCTKNYLNISLATAKNQKQFRVIEENLAENEDVMVAFIGLHNFASFLSHNDEHGYAVTDKNLLISKSRVFGNFFMSVPIKDLVKIDTAEGKVFDVINFYTNKASRISVGVEKKMIDNIMKKLREVLPSFMFEDGAPSDASSIADELRELKDLLDDGILSPDEFEEQKRKILNR